MLDVATNFARLVGLELRRSWILTLRYRTEAALSLAFLVALFYGIAFGTRWATFGQFSVGDGVEGLLLGFICWILATGGVSHVANDIEEEAKTGTLEPLFVGDPGPEILFLARNTAGLVAGLPMLLLVAAALTLATGSSFHLSPAALLPLLALDLAASGIGFALGALAILVKHVRVAVIVVQLGVVALLITRIDLPAATWVLNLLPLAPDVESLRQMMLSGSPLTVATAALLLANGAAYFGTGLAMFFLAIRRARRLGLLAQH
jgi:ABC-2 type transport system permease protein